MSYSNLDIIKVTWSEIRSKVIEVNPALAEVVDAREMPPGAALYRARYQYGQKIANKGALNLPTKDGTVVNLHSDIVPHELSNDLSYSSLPIGVILTNTAEVFREVGNKRVLPLAFFEPGVPLGLLETLEPPGSCCVRNVWDVIAGARSIFMLAKISDGLAHKKLQRETGITTPQPKEMFDHFSVFRDLHKSDAIKEKWETEVLFFSKVWFEEKPNDVGWLKFFYFLHHYLFSFSGYSRNKPTIDLIWDGFCEELMQTNQQPQPHIYETVRHLFAMACGAVPGFSPAISDNAGPVSYIQDIYYEIYGLDKAPTIMSPKHFSLSSSHQPVYHSINLMTRFRSIPKKRSKVSLSQELHQIRSLIEYFYVSFYDGKLELGNTWFQKVIDSVRFNYFHIEPSDSVGILDPAVMPESDRNLILVNNEISNLPFKYDSQFLRGCIKISKKANSGLANINNTPLS
jgi:hypothetical protein